ncbi:Rap guanine nucleotide exchange factor-like 1 [Paramecium bursaria]
MINFYQSRHSRTLFMNNIQNIDKDKLMELSLFILAKHPQDRNLEEITVLQYTLQNIKFFEDIIQQQGTGTLQKCMKRMVLNLFDQNTIVFERGEKGHTFYVILQGQVGVYVQNLTDPQSKKQRNSSIFMTSMLSRIRKSSTDIAPDMRKVAVESRIKGLLKVNVLKEGDYFGERALINDAPRLATIVCETNCVFAVLNKKDYKEILYEAQQQKITEQIEQLREFQAFRNLSRRLLNILLFAFQKQEFKYKQVVYKQNDSSQQSLFLIIDGEFTLLTRIKRNGLEVNQKIAILQHGATFGDFEAFHHLDKRVHTVYCSTESGNVLQIDLEQLIQRLQASNEMHLFDNLKQQCEVKETVRTRFQSQIRPSVQRYDRAKLSETDIEQPKTRTKTQPDGKSPKSGSCTDAEKINQIVESNKQIFQRLSGYSASHSKKNSIMDIELSPFRPPEQRISQIGSSSTVERVLNQSRISKRVRRSICLSFHLQRKSFM